MTFESDCRQLLRLITPYSIEDADWSILYEYALRQVDADAGSAPDHIRAQMVCMWIAHSRASGQGKVGLTSEHLGQWSASFGAKSSQWLDEYNRLKNSVAGESVRASVRSGGCVVPIRDNIPPLEYCDGRRF